ncbi:tail fiber assembly protein [Ewingella sp. AOP9-I1-14]
MNTYVWSANKNLLLPVSLQEAYEDAGSWPEDTVDISDEVAMKFMKTPEAGKVRGVVDKMPAWVDAPPPTKAQYLKQAEIKKSELLNEAGNITSDWRTELALGVISDKDKESLILWMAYIKDVKAVSLSNAPNVTWPDKPSS